MPACRKRTRWGRCKQQRAEGFKLCSAHEFWSGAGVTPDAYYEAKVVKGIVKPTWDWMSESEANAVLNGRYRGDGRRIDQYVTGDPLMIDVEGLHRG